MIKQLNSLLLYHMFFFPHIVTFDFEVCVERSLSARADRQCTSYSEYIIDVQVNVFYIRLYSLVARCPVYTLNFTGYPVLKIFLLKIGFCISYLLQTKEKLCFNLNMLDVLEPLGQIRYFKHTFAL